MSAIRVETAFLKCPLCGEWFDQQTRCPNMLSCGHCVCSVCVEIALATEPVACPMCQTSLLTQAKTVNDIDLNVIIVGRLGQATMPNSPETEISILKAKAKEAIATQMNILTGPINFIKELKGHLSIQKRKHDVASRSVIDLCNAMNDIRDQLEEEENYVETLMETAAATCLCLEKVKELVETTTTVKGLTAIQKHISNTCDSTRTWHEGAEAIRKRVTLSKAQLAHHLIQLFVKEVKSHLSGPKISSLPSLNPLKTKGGASSREIIQKKKRIFKPRLEVRKLSGLHNNKISAVGCTPKDTSTPSQSPPSLILESDKISVGYKSAINARANAARVAKLGTGAKAKVNRVNDEAIITVNARVDTGANAKANAGANVRINANANVQGNARADTAINAKTNSGVNARVNGKGNARSSAEVNAGANSSTTGVDAEGNAKVNDGIDAGTTAGLSTGNDAGGDECRQNVSLDRASETSSTISAANSAEYLDLSDSSIELDFEGFDEVSTPVSLYHMDTAHELKGDSGSVRSLEQRMQGGPPQTVSNNSKRPASGHESESAAVLTQRARIQIPNFTPRILRRSRTVSGGYRRNDYERQNEESSTNRHGRRTKKIDYRMLANYGMTDNPEELFEDEETEPSVPVQERRRSRPRRNSVRSFKDPAELLEVCLNEINASDGSPSKSVKIVHIQEESPSGFQSETQQERHHYSGISTENEPMAVSANVGGETQDGMLAIKEEIKVEPEFVYVDQGIDAMESSSSDFNPYDVMMQDVPSYLNDPDVIMQDAPLSCTLSSEKSTQLMTSHEFEMHIQNMTSSMKQSERQMNDTSVDLNYSESQTLDMSAFFNQSERQLQPMPSEGNQAVGLIQNNSNGHPDKQVEPTQSAASHSDKQKEARVSVICHSDKEKLVSSGSRQSGKKSGVKPWRFTNQRFAMQKLVLNSSSSNQLSDFRDTGELLQVNDKASECDPADEFRDTPSECDPADKFRDTPSECDPAGKVIDKPSECDPADKFRDTPSECDPAGKVIDRPSECDLADKFRETPSECDPAGKVKDKPLECVTTGKVKDKPSECGPADNFKDKPSECDPADILKDKPSECSPADRFKDKPSECDPADKLKDKPSECDSADKLKDKPSECGTTVQVKDKSSECGPADKFTDKPSECDPADRFTDKPSECSPVDKFKDKSSECGPADIFKDKPSVCDPADIFKDKPSVCDPADKFTDRPSQCGPADIFKDKPSECGPADIFKDKPSVCDPADKFKDKPSECGTTGKVNDKQSECGPTSKWVVRNSPSGLSVTNTETQILSSLLSQGDKEKKDVSSGGLSLKDKQTKDTPSSFSHDDQQTENMFLGFTEADKEKQDAPRGFNLTVEQKCNTPLSISHNIDKEIRELPSSINLSEKGTQDMPSDCSHTNKETLDTLPDLSHTDIQNEMQDMHVDFSDSDIEMEGICESVKQTQESTSEFSKCEEPVPSTSTALSGSDVIMLDPPPNDNDHNTGLSDEIVTVDALRKSLKTSAVWAMTFVKGKPRSARISQQGTRLFLHALRDGAPPSTATVVEYTRVQKLAKHNLTFLELAWPEVEKEVRGKIYVLVSEVDMESSPTQFHHLCAGDIGPSYADSHLLEHWSLGIWGGDYITDTGVSAEALPGMVCQAGGRVELNPGVVIGGVAWGQPSQFVIICSKRGSFTRGPSIGEVLEGMDIVEAARKVRGGSVRVADCGLVLTF